MSSTIGEILKDLKDELYPIGMIVMFNDSKDHSRFLDLHWARCLPGRVPVGVDASDSDFDTVGKLAGEKVHQLTVDEMPAHGHNFKLGGTVTGGKLALGWRSLTIDDDNHSDDSMIKTSGGNESHNNVQPSEVVAFWRRYA